MSIIITIIHVIIVRIIDRMEDRQVEAELGRPKRPADPNKVLLVSVLNQLLIPIYCDVAYRAFSQFGTVVRVAIFNRVTVQVSFAFFTLFFFRTFRAVALSVHLMLLLHVMVEYKTL